MLEVFQLIYLVLYLYFVQQIRIVSFLLIKLDICIYYYADPHIKHQKPMTYLG